MASYVLKWSHTAKKFYNKLSGNALKQVNKALMELQNDPYSTNQVKKLKGVKQVTYRKRAGDIRIIYTVDSGEQSLFLL
jgi:Cytotoxic translational repressor of toxin-antitoxin stability system